MSMISYTFAKRQGVAIEALDEQGARLLIRQKTALSAIAEVRRILDRPVSVRIVEDEDFTQYLRQQHSESDSGLQDSTTAEDMDLGLVAETLPEPADLLESEDDAPIIRLINAMLTQAIKEKASDIHIEPFERSLSIRYRVDGVLREVLNPNGAIAPLVAARIKVMAELDIAEKRLPQDGRISLKIAGHPVDVRVSTLPSAWGERVVMRLLDRSSGRLSLDQIGLQKQSLENLEHLIQRPHGIVLVTGPTGSGKTTTLYAALSRLNASSRNILTIEDPIEYDLEGVGQTQVNPHINMSFARGLRAILRQDPDVVMVGEIRDSETAQVATQASLTGHLVLSTLHTNSALGAISRLQDMGVESFLLATSLAGVVAQRLVRKLCPQCRSEVIMKPVQLQAMGLPHDKEVRVHKAVGCAACHHSGYQGRTGIYEVVIVDDTLQALIHQNASKAELEAIALRNYHSLFADGWRLVQAGETSVEELLRVTTN